MSASRTEVAARGAVAGLLGYATVALSVGLMDLGQGRSFFYTVSLLGDWLFYGLYDPTKMFVWAGGVFAYNGVHLLTYLAFGLMAAWLASMSTKGALYWYAGLVLYILVFLHILGAVLFMTEPVRAVLPMYQVVLPGVLSGVVMSVYLLRAFPEMRQAMRTWADPDDGNEVPTAIPRP